MKVWSREVDDKTCMGKYNKNYDTAIKVEIICYLGNTFSSVKI